MNVFMKKNFRIKKCCTLFNTIICMNLKLWKFCTIFQTLYKAVHCYYGAVLLMYRYGSCSTRVRLYRKWWLARFRRRVYGHTCSHTAVCTTHWVSRRWPRCLRLTRVLFTPSSVRWSSMKNSWYVGLPFSHL